MKNKILLLFLITLVNTASFAQSSEDVYWNHLLLNERVKATKSLKKIKSKSIKTLLISEINRLENGNFTKNDGFVEKFLKYPDAEKYLYALWNEQYLFTDYLDSGFNKYNIENIETVYNSNLKDRAIKDAMSYLYAVSNRYQGDWKTFINANKKIDYISDWQFCGVFENLNKSGLDRVYPPENNPTNAEMFDAESNGMVNWYTASKTNEPYQFFTNHDQFGSGVHYAQTFINTPQEKRVRLRIANGSAFKVWLNDILIFENTEDVTTDLNAYQVKVNLPKGKNRLLIKNAEGNAGSYFAISILDEDESKIESITHNSSYAPYNSSNLEDLNPEIIRNKFELFFEQKVKENPSDFFYKYCLVNTYLRNEKAQEAKKVLEPLLEVNPKSSLLNRLMLSVSVVELDYTKINTVVKNMEINDEEYYLPMVLKVADSDKLSKMSVEELELFFVKLKNGVDLDILETTASLMLAARKQDMGQVKSDFEKVISQAKERKDASMLIKFAPLYASLYNSDEKTIELFEELNKDYFSYVIPSNLSYYYDKLDQKDKSISVLSRHLDYLSKDITYLNRLVRKLHKYERFEESLQYINTALSVFPYSFVTLELKGDAMLRMNKKKEAIEFYEQALSFDTANKKLRKTIRDLKREDKILDQIVFKEVYKFIETNRDKVKTNNYGYNLLFEESNIELYTEGGGESRFIYVYEVTSNSGVERFKEYNLGLSGSYSILKSEIVKHDKSVVPAERSGSKLVFNSLSIGDVIYIEYEYSFANRGRFYKDFTDYYQFDSFHPTIRTSCNIVMPNDKKLNYKVINGDLVFKTKKIANTHTLYTWSLDNLECLPEDEAYMPNAVDISRGLHLSTISEWNEISNWYSDLVRSRIKINSTVQKTFDNLFPNGIDNLSEIERAKIIYNYIVTDFTYSYVSFKQSGYVPQLASKTIETKMGDCKDFSTLFITLGQMAKIKANLVLVLTSDNGQDDLVLPSAEFNHCIVRLQIDNKEQFLELTSKYLPFGAHPISLVNATALNIPYKTSGSQTKSSLFKLKNAERMQTEYLVNATIKLGADKSVINLVNEHKGHTEPYYFELLEEPNEEVRKASFYKNLKANFEAEISLDEFKELKGKHAKYMSTVTVNDELKQMGDIKIYKLPQLISPYTSDIISSKEREFPIEYTQYETVDLYSAKYDIILDSGNKFIEVPESKKFQFKGHSYEITYSLKSTSNLEIVILAKPSLENIHPDDYDAYKKYVQDILSTESALIGFK